MKKEITNIAASVRKRLYDRAKQTNRPFDELLQYYAMERFLYRLSISTHRDKFVLKGALMFVVWKAPRARATKDMDFLAKTKNSIDNLVEVVREVCVIAVEPDGVLFDPKTVIGERIKENAEYEGVRVRFKGQLEQARVSMQIDVGFGDTVTPAPAVVDYPVILEFPAPRLKGYPPETVVAEKFEAMVKLGEVNTRMKDFYDLWLLREQFSFEGPVLAEALKTTFSNRETELSVDPVAFSESFATDRQRQTQWSAFLRKTKLSHAPEQFKDVIGLIMPFLRPVLLAVISSKRWDRHWKASGPWSL